MSSLWTPGGERPVRSEEPPRAAPPRAPEESEAGELTEEEMAARLAEVQQQLAQTPAAVVIANHAMGLFELAALHLSQEPPNLAESQVAIDAMAALVDALAGRLGEDEHTLKDGLAQLRLAFVQLRGTDAAEG